MFYLVFHYIKFREEFADILTLVDNKLLTFMDSKIDFGKKLVNPNSFLWKIDRVYFIFFLYTLKRNIHRVYQKICKPLKSNCFRIHMIQH